MTPVFGHGHLRLYLLKLLDTSPMHGYELIQALEDQSGGTYTPSAGTIYPRLAKLEADGLVTKAVDGRKTVYAITDAGRAELNDRQHELNDIEDDLTDTVRHLADEVRQSVNDAMKSLRADLAAAARDARNQAKSEPSSASTRVRETSSSHLREAEIVVNQFRHQLRAELRSKAARGELTEVHVSTLKAQLDTVRLSLFGTN